MLAQWQKPIWAFFAKVQQTPAAEECVKGYEAGKAFLVFTLLCHAAALRTFLHFFLTWIMPFICWKAKVCFLLCCSAPFELLFLFCKSQKRETEENTNQPCSTALGVFLMLLYIQIKWTDTHVCMCMSHNWDWKKKGLSRQFIYVWKYINHTHNTHTYAYTGSNSKSQSQVWFGTTMFICGKKLKNGAEVRFYFFNNKEKLRRNVHIHIKQQHEGAA